MGTQVTPIIEDVDKFNKSVDKVLELPIKICSINNKDCGIFWYKILQEYGYILPKLKTFGVSLTKGLLYYDKYGERAKVFLYRFLRKIAKKVEYPLIGDIIVCSDYSFWLVVPEGKVLTIDYVGRSRRISIEQFLKEHNDDILGIYRLDTTKVEYENR